MNAPAAPYTPEQTMALLYERSKTSSDRFVVKIHRKKGLTGLMEAIATLAEATVAQIAATETWIPRLCGGGEFNMAVYHADEPMTRLGAFLPISLRGDVREVDIDAPRQRDWQGPGILIFPATAADRPQFAASPPLASPFQQYAPTVFPANAGPAVTQPAGMPIEFLEAERRRADEWARRERDFAEQRAKMEKDIALREEELKRQRGEERIRSEMGGQIAELKALMVAGQSTNGQPSGTTVLVTTLIGALAPIMQEMIKQSSEYRQMTLKAQQEQAMQMQTFFAKMNEKPALSPEVTMMLEMMKSQSTGAGEMMSRIVDAMGTVSKTSVSMIEAVADIQLGGPSESPILGAVREGVRALMTLSNGATAGARKIVDQSQQHVKLPSGKPQQPPQKPQQQQPAQRQADVVQFPKPAEAPEQEQQAAFGDMDAELPFVDQLEQMIRAKHDPEVVAGLFIEAIVNKEPSLMAALKAADGDPSKLLGERLSDWLLADDENPMYIEQLGVAMDRIGIEAGVFEPEPGDGPQQDSNDVDGSVVDAPVSA